MQFDKFPRWLFASISKYFSDALSPLQVVLINTPDFLKLDGQRVELYVNGPHVTPQSQTTFHIDLEVMLNIFVVIDDKDFHGIYRLQGKILKLMLAAIPIYEFGDDNTQLIRCIAVKDNEQITTMNYGVVDTKIRMCQSLMRGQYTMEITDGSV